MVIQISPELKKRECKSTILTTDMSRLWDVICRVGDILNTTKHA